MSWQNRSHGMAFLTYLFTWDKPLLAVVAASQQLSLCELASYHQTNLLFPSRAQTPHLHARSSGEQGSILPGPLWNIGFRSGAAIVGDQTTRQTFQNSPSLVCGGYTNTNSIPCMFTKHFFRPPCGSWNFGEKKANMGDSSRTRILGGSGPEWGLQDGVPMSKSKRTETGTGTGIGG